MFHVSHSLDERDRNVATSYHGGLRRYARLKLRYDPVYSEVAERLIAADAPVLDIGSGIGLLGLYLHERGFRNRYHGIDCDAEKISRARRSANECAAPLTFEARDAVVLPPFSGSVVLLDVLHYMDRERQRAVLRSQHGVSPETQHSSFARRCRSRRGGIAPRSAKSGCCMAAAGCKCRHCISRNEWKSNRRCRNSACT